MHGFKPRTATQIEARPNFSSLLNEAPGEVKFSPPPPQGCWVAVVQPGWRQDTNARTGNDFHEFLFKLIEPLEDVDADDLKGWTVEHGDVGAKLYKRQFYITPDALPYLDQFHEACGLDLAKLQKSHVSRLLRNDEVANCYVGVYLKHKPFSDGSGKVQAVIDRFFAVDEG